MSLDAIRCAELLEMPPIRWSLTDGRDVKDQLRDALELLAEAKRVCSRNIKVGGNALPETWNLFDKLTEAGIE